MKRYIKTLLAVLTAIVGFVSVQIVLADDVAVTGVIVETDRLLSTIVIEDENMNIVSIQGFPFKNLEAQLDEILDPLDPEEDGITIDADDCVTVVYSEKEHASGDVVNKWESLITYCEECTSIECYEDEDPLTRKPQKNKNRPNPWPWHGTPPGHRR